MSMHQARDGLREEQQGESARVLCSRIYQDISKERGHAAIRWALQEGHDQEQKIALANAKAGAERQVAGTRWMLFLALHMSSCSDQKIICLNCTRLIRC